MNTLTVKQWKEAKEGFGLEELPKELRREFQCAMCGYDSRGKLWTDQAVSIRDTDGTLKDYQRKQRALEDLLRSNCYCRYHAESMFGPREGEA